MTTTNGPAVQDGFRIEGTLMAQLNSELRHKPDERCYVSREQNGYIASSHCLGNTPSDIQVEVQYASHLQ
jgi:hypothetical protein